MALTKDDIVEELVTKKMLNRREAVDIVDTFFDEVKLRLSAGERVLLPGFGSFFLQKQRYQRKRRDIPIDENTPVWTTPSFKPAAKLHARVQRASYMEAMDVD